MDINRVLNNFTGVKRIKEGQWRVICPCHSDDNASLIITNASDKILMKCMAGCSTSDILDASGLTWTDLGEPERKKEFTALDKIEYGQQQRYGENTFIKDKYDYYDENGKYLYTKVRFEGGHFDGNDKKMIRYYQIDYANNTYQSGKPKGCKKVLYRLPKLRAAIKEGYPINIVEGEKDVHTLEKFGWTATTPGGVNDWLPEFAKYFKGADVRIFPDNDKAGETLAKKISGDLRYYAYRVRIVKTSQAEKGDVTDYLGEGGHNKETLQALIQEAPATYSPWVDINKNSETINTDKLARAFDKNENYLITRNSNGGGHQIYMYENGVYKPSSPEDLRGRIMDYYGYGKVTNNSTKNVKELLMCRGSHFCQTDELNADEDIINLKNGILHLSTMELTEHDPKYLTTAQLDVEYDPNAHDMPVFTKYITDLCLDDYGEVDQSKIDVLQEVLGLVLSNVYGYRTKKAVFLHSFVGNSGKTQFINLAMDMVGRSRCIVVQLQNMNSDANNRFVFAGLPTARIVCCGDQTGADVKESATFKRLTGGDSVAVEKKGVDIETLHYKGCLLYGTNIMPNFQDDKGDQILERLLIVPFYHTVPEAERDKTMEDRMFAERTAIFNWAMVGIKRLIANNFIFSTSEAVSQVTKDFRSRIDTVSRFLDANGYAITKNMNDRINAMSLFKDYTDWCQDPENDITHYIQSKNSFADRMLGRGVKKKKQSGEVVFLGILQGFKNTNDNDGVPF